MKKTPIDPSIINYLQHSAETEVPENSAKQFVEAVGRYERTRPRTPGKCSHQQWDEISYPDSEGENPEMEIPEIH
ncbi:MAG: hypothetical protein EAZ82_12265 [Verrucomicrobia bacterium]|nr:MAG: hypothetical protein EAZ82_12265 [Verrucomicrobiota bacterium]